MSDSDITKVIIPSTSTSTKKRKSQLEKNRGTSNVSKLRKTLSSNQMKKLEKEASSKKKDAVYLSKYKKEVRRQLTNNEITREKYDELVSNKEKEISLRNLTQRLSDKKSVGVNEEAANRVLQEYTPSRQQEKRRKFIKEKKTKGGYRYSDLGMKGLTIFVTDGDKVNSANKTRKVIRKGKMTRKGRKGNKKENKKGTIRRRKN